MTYSADSGYGPGSQMTHDHDVEFSHECEACLAEFWDDIVLRRITRGDTLADAREYADRELAEMLAEYEED